MPLVTAWCPVSPSTALVKLAKQNDELCVGAVGYCMVPPFLRRQLVKLAKENDVHAVGLVKLAKENEESCVDAVGYGMVPRVSVSPSAALVKLTKEMMSRASMPLVTACCSVSPTPA